MLPVCVYLFSGVFESKILRFLTKALAVMSASHSQLTMSSFAIMEQRTMAIPSFYAMEV